MPARADMDQPTHPATANSVRSTVSFDLTATEKLATAARTAMDVWPIEYNMVRPHQVLDREVPQAERLLSRRRWGGSCEPAVGIQVRVDLHTSHTPAAARCEVTRPRNMTIDRGLATVACRSGSRTRAGNDRRTTGAPESAVASRPDEVSAPTRCDPRWSVSRGRVAR
jgi:hypothetical protein